MMDTNEMDILKQAIITAGQEMVRSGLVVGTWGNVSARVPGTDRFVITPSGKNYLHLVPEDLVVMNLAGEVVGGQYKPSSEFHLHLYTYRARPEIQGVVHTHSIFATAHAVSRVPVPCCAEDLAMITGGDVRVAPYALPGSEELAHNAVTTMGDGWAVLLANHGMVGVGRSVEEALLVCQIVEKAAQINLMACSLGQPQNLAQRDIDTLRHKYLTSYSLMSQETVL